MIIVDERKPAAPIALDLTHVPAIGNDNENLGHFWPPLAVLTTASMSTGGDVVARTSEAITGIDPKGQAESREGAQHQSELGTGFTVLDAHDPLPSDADFASEVGLAQLELAASVAND